MSELPRETVLRLYEGAEYHYSDDMPYHNWVHALDVIGHADEIADMAESAGNDIDRDALLLSAAWHDTDYHLPMGQESREERSAILARSRIMWHDPDLADNVAHAIIDTTVDKCPKSSPLGVALHFADVGYLAAPNYQQFFRRLDLMRQEWGVGEDGWRDVSHRTRRFGQTVIEEAREELPQLLSSDDIERWVRRIETNLNELHEWSHR
jgi:hypothetical protein